MRLLKSFAIVFLLSLKLVHCTYSQDSISEYKVGTQFKSDFKDYYKGIGYIYSRPFHWKKKGWITFGAVTAGTFLLSYADEPLYDYFQNRHSKFADKLERIGDFGGQPVPGFILAGSMYFTGLAINKPWLRRSGVTTLIAISSAGLFQTLTKGSTGRGRPSAGKGNWHFRPFDPSPAFHSFPSGHTIVAMSTAFVLAKNSKSKVLKGLFLTYGGITAWSRLYSGAHWLTDVTLSTVVSYLSVESTFKFLEKREKKRRLVNGLSPESSAKVEIFPSINGLSLKLCW